MFFKKIFLLIIVCFCLIENVRAEMPAEGCFVITNQSSCVSYSGCKWYGDSNGGVCLPLCNGNACVGYDGVNCIKNVDNLTQQNYRCFECGENGFGAFATEDSLDCIACDGDNQYFDNDGCKTCAGNKMANDSHDACNGGCLPGYECFDVSCSICVKCVAGYQCPGKFESKQLCQIGTFAAAGQAKCSSCPAGYTTQNTGSGVVTDCVAGAVRLAIGNGAVDLPNCLKKGKVNNRVVRNIND